MFNDSDNGQTQYCEECQKWAEKYKRLESEFEQYKKSKQASYEAMQNEWNKAILENRRLKSEFSEILDAKCETIAALKTENDELKKDIETGTMCITCERELQNCELQIEIERLKVQIDIDKNQINYFIDENEELRKENMVLRNGYDEEDCTLTCPSLVAYRQSDEEGQEIIAELKAEIKELRDSLMEAEAIIITYQLKGENKND